MMNIDQAWLMDREACEPGIVRFVEWAGDTPQSLEAIAKRHPYTLDVIWLLDQLATKTQIEPLCFRIASMAVRGLYRMTLAPELVRFLNINNFDVLGFALPAVKDIVQAEYYRANVDRGEVLDRFQSAIQCAYRTELYDAADCLYDAVWFASALYVPAAQCDRDADSVIAELSAETRRMLIVCSFAEKP